MIFRPNTYDESIWGDNTIRNAYKLPENFPDGSIMIDIGAHIGSVSHEAVRRGASKVFAFEASRENFEIAQQNLMTYILDGKVEIFNLAVWNVEGVYLPLYKGKSGAINTGGFSVFSEWDTDENVERATTTSLDTILRSTVEYNPVEILKFDCEGAEYKIFYGSTLFPHQVKRLVGETHEGSMGNTKELAAFFQSKGYRIMDTNDSPTAHLGWIDAVKI